MLQTILKELGDYFHCEPNTEAIERALYKNTECGANIKISEEPERGVIIELGSIIEGQCGEVTTTPYVSSEEEVELSEWLDTTIEYVEGEVNARYTEELE